MVCILTHMHELAPYSHQATQYGQLYKPPSVAVGWQNCGTVTNHDQTQEVDPPLSWHRVATVQNHLNHHLQDNNIK